MTPREVIKGNLYRTGPDRIGFRFGEDRRNDLCGTGLAYPKMDYMKSWVKDGFEYNVDIWGNTWYRVIGMSRKGEVFAPAIEDWAQLKDYQVPDLADPTLFEPVAEKFSRETEKYRLGGLPGFPFAICRYLRKMENYLLDLAAERENIDRLHEMVTDLLEKMIRQYGRSGADGIIFAEDWGTQERLLVSPPMWRDIFKPLFKRLCGVAHDCGLDVLMHSCGYNQDILDDLAEVGVNAFQFDQPALYGLERLAAQLRDMNVCLFSPVDIQRVLPTGEKERIVGEARRMIDLFARPDGGLIACHYGDLHGIGVKPEWDAWMYETFVQYGDLK